ncbi:hypothetical protein PI124_g3485 [Phytophthora idaei]|nr:hypothetical protein PI125_g3085 [Phytophthora idaei]KAG3168608.1 hypothetical protein PI126_g3247 [Phytophthora idaei]KAG3251955.1 hypothetical protein PI124_g3485 [Phytophthora idaei]
MAQMATAVAYASASPRSLSYAATASVSSVLVVSRVSPTADPGSPSSAASKGVHESDEELLDRLLDWSPASDYLRAMPVVVWAPVVLSTSPVPVVSLAVLSASTSPFMCV